MFDDPHATTSELKEPEPLVGPPDLCVGMLLDRRGPLDRGSSCRVTSRQVPAGGILVPACDLGRSPLGRAVHRRGLYPGSASQGRAREHGLQAALDRQIIRRTAVAQHEVLGPLNARQHLTKALFLSKLVKSLL